jgi:aspartate carbamoyltransferase catalytic subunit
MTPAPKSTYALGHRHLLGIEGLSAGEIRDLPHISYVEHSRRIGRKSISMLRAHPVHLSFEVSNMTRPATMSGA